jgi:hypothetical protein
VTKLQDIAQQHGHALSNAEAISSTVIAEITTPAKGERQLSSDMLLVSLQDAKCEMTKHRLVTKPPACNSYQRRNMMAAAM